MENLPAFHQAKKKYNNMNDSPSYKTQILRKISGFVCLILKGVNSSLLYLILIENIPVSVLCDINRKCTHPCNINSRVVIKDLYHAPFWQSSDVISHPIPQTISYHDVEPTLISKYNVMFKTDIRRLYHFVWLDVRFVCIMVS